MNNKPYLLFKADLNFLMDAALQQAVGEGGGLPW